MYTEQAYIHIYIYIYPCYRSLDGVPVAPSSDNGIYVHLERKHARSFVALSLVGAKSLRRSPSRMWPHEYSSR